MTFKKLLASAGTAALLAGAASAATITDKTPICVANEIDLTTAPTATVSLDVVAVGSEFQADTEYSMTVSVSGAAFAADLDATVLDTAGSAIAFSTPIVTGGEEEGTTATVFFEITTDSTTGQDIQVDLPLAYSAAGDVSVTLAITSEGGSPTLQSETETIITSVDGVSAAISATGNALKISPADPTAFVSGTTTASTSDLGQVELTLPIYATSDCSAGTTTTGGTAASDTAFTAAPIAAGDFTLAVTATPDTAQTATLTTAFNAGAATTTTADLGDALSETLTATTAVFEVVTAGDADLVPTTVSAVATLTNTDLVDIEVASTPVDELEFDGEDANLGAGGAMRWFAMSATTANSVIRCTATDGFSDGVSVEVDIDNSTDVTDGSYTLATAPVADATEFVISASTIATATGSTGRADITDISFVGESNAVICDRLLVNTTTGTVTPFGNEGK